MSYLGVYSSYVLFTCVPDYFEGEFMKGVVSKVSFSEKTNSAELIVDYNVGKEKLQYKTDMYFQRAYKPGQPAAIIYNPSDPPVSSIYAFIGCWIRWHVLIFTSAFLLFFLLRLGLLPARVAGNHVGYIVM
jgi:hypothetical protein